MGSRKADRLMKKSGRQQKKADRIGRKLERLEERAGKVRVKGEHKSLDSYETFKEALNEGGVPPYKEPPTDEL